ncbi:MAG: hypothetical protein GF364_11765 [Candidatus Lokiarchaeota archaeon]|nr:hypothetical protein [Candidatus Lokiarchaeota archaeon]
MVRPPVSDSICIRCKGARLLCGKKSCPILKKASILKSTVPFNYKKVQRNKTLFGASPPAVFVGRYGYPNVNIGPMIPVDEIFLQDKLQISKKDTGLLDISELWYGKSLDDIITFRTSMVRSNFKVNIQQGINQTGGPRLLRDVRRKLTSGDNRLLDSTQELAMSKISVDTETKFSKLRVNLSYDVHSPPVGPSGITEKIDVVDNIKAHPKVEYVVDDRDLKAADAIFDYLYPTSITNDRVKDPSLSRVVTGTEMQRLLSAGLLGSKNKRKIVPTRWSITAVDSIISKKLAKQIKRFPEINQYFTFHQEYLDNNFVILMIPGPWSYEMMEVWNADTIWTQVVPGIQPAIRNREPQIVQDYEMEHGRKTYADNVTGAYYAARKEVTEFLYLNRRQARVIVFREVSGGYIVPLGVWVIRETVRKGLENGFQGDNVIKHDNLPSALAVVRDHFNVPLSDWLHASKLLSNIRKQRRLDEWIEFKPRKIA